METSASDDAPIASSNTPLIIIAVVVVVIILIVAFKKSSKSSPTAVQPATATLADRKSDIIQNANAAANSTLGTFNYEIKDSSPYAYVVYINDANIYDYRASLNKLKSGNTAYIFLLRTKQDLNLNRVWGIANESVLVNSQNINGINYILVANIYCYIGAHAMEPNTCILYADGNCQFYFTTNTPSALTTSPSVALVKSVNSSLYADHWNNAGRLQVVTNTDNYIVAALITANTTPITSSDLSNDTLPLILANDANEWDRKYKHLIVKDLNADSATILLANSYRLKLANITTFVGIVNAHETINYTLVKSFVPQAYGFSVISFGEYVFLILFDRLSRGNTSLPGNELQIVNGDFSIQFIDAPVYNPAGISTSPQKSIPPIDSPNLLTTADLILGDVSKYMVKTELFPINISQLQGYAIAVAVL